MPRQNRNNQPRVGNTNIPNPNQPHHQRQAPRRTGTLCEPRESQIGIPRAASGLQRRDPNRTATLPALTTRMPRRRPPATRLLALIADRDSQHRHSRNHRDAKQNKRAHRASHPCQCCYKGKQLNRQDTPTTKQMSRLAPESPPRRRPPGPHRRRTTINLANRRPRRQIPYRLSRRPVCILLHQLSDHLDKPRMRPRCRRPGES